MQNLTNIYKKLKGTNWKRIENTLIFTSVIFFVMGTLNLYAVEGIKLDINAGYDNIQPISKALALDGEPNKLTDGFGGNLTYMTDTAIAICGIETCFEVKDEVAYNELSPLQKYGLVGGVSNGITALYQSQPSVNLVAHLGSEWVPGYDTTDYGIYAADTGYDALVGAGITNLWNTTRNLAYILFVIVLIVAGFMIMFRQKIGGQLAVSVFNVIPRVITNLVLVTFSFAIVGIIIDFGALLVRVIAGILTDGVSYKLITSSSPFSLFGVFFGGGNFAQYWSSLGVFDTFGSGLAATLTGALGVAGGFALTAVPAIGATLATGIMALLLVIVISAIVGWASIRVYITLLKAYIGLLIDTVMGPIYIAFSTLPGSNSTTEWFKRLVKNTLTFPFVFLFINLGMYLLISGADIGFPRGLTGGDIVADQGNTTFIGLFIKGSIVIALFFIAAEVPKFLEDMLPSAGGKGAAAALESAREGFGKIPVIGGMFGK